MCNGCVPLQDRVMLRRLVTREDITSKPNFLISGYSLPTSSSIEAIT